MRPQDLEPIELAVGLVVKSAACWTWIEWDARRALSSVKGRAWPESTQLAGSVVFQEVALLVYFLRAHGGWRGIAWGLLSVVTVNLATLAVLAPLELLLLDDEVSDLRTSGERVLPSTRCLRCPDRSFRPRAPRRFGVGSRASGPRVCPSPQSSAAWAFFSAEWPFAS